MTMACKSRLFLLVGTQFAGGHHRVDDALPCGLRRDVQAANSIKGVLVHGDVHHGGLLAHHAGGCCSGASRVQSPCVSATLQGGSRKCHRRGMMISKQRGMMISKQASEISAS